MKLLVSVVTAAFLLLLVLCALEIGFVKTVGITALAFVGFTLFGIMLVRAFKLW